VSIQKASSSTTSLLHYKKTRCKHQYLQLKDILPIVHPASLESGWRDASFTYFPAHAGMTSTMLCRKSWAPSSPRWQRALPEPLPKIRYLHTLGMALERLSPCKEGSSPGLWLLAPEASVCL